MHAARTILAATLLILFFLTASEDITHGVVIAVVAELILQGLRQREDSDRSDGPTPKRDG